jgi:AcrR family transcriptional regulator
LENSKQNPIAEQSRIWLMQALIRLMERQPYRTITISQITQEAQLARRTFYRNFASKDDILFLYTQKLCDEYEEILRKQKDLSLPNIGYAFFCFWSEHRNFLQLMEYNQMTPLLLQKFNEYLPSLHAALKREVKERFKGHEEILSYGLTFSAGGFMNILSKWMQDGMKQSPEEMAAIIKHSLMLISDN